MTNITGKKVTMIVFRLLRIPLTDLLQDFEASAHLCPEQLREYQWKRIRNLLEHAVSSSEYYRRLLKTIGATVNDIKSYRDFEKIPVTSKETLKKRWREFVCKPRPIFQWEARTSGSTGVPLKLYKDARAIASTYAAMYQGHRWWGIDIGAKEAKLWGIPLSAKGKLEVRIKDILLNRFRQKSLEISDDVFNEFYRQIKRKRPVYLMGYPSYIYSFVKFIQRRGLDGRRLDLRLVKYTGESLYEDQKQKIEETLGCPCVSEYGSAETGVISFECPHRNHHIMSSSVYVEFEKKGLLPGNSQCYGLVVTNLYSHSFPIIRYRVGDIAVPSNKPCSCGLGFPTISRVIGRSHDMIVTSNGKVYHSSILAHALKRLISHETRPQKIRFVQRRIGELEVMVANQGKILKSYDKIIREVITTAFDGSISVKVAQVPKIERECSGKFRYFISYLKDEDKESFFKEYSPR